MAIFQFEKYLRIKRVNIDQIHAHCPFHDDRTPSFSANLVTGLWKCFGGCGEGDYTLFISLYKNRYSKAEEYLETEAIFSKNIRPSLIKKSEYFYVNEQLEIRQKVIRLDHKNGTKTFYQEHKTDNGIWLSGRYPGVVAPYRYQDWSLRNNDLYFVEGEKCAEFLISYGFDATTVIGGAKNWNNQDSIFFTNRRVVILPDNDEPGLLFAESVKLNLEKSALVKTLLLPGLRSKEDVVDWFQKDATNDCDVLKAMVSRLFSA